MHSGLSIWLQVILAWKHIENVPEVRSRIDAIETGNIDEDEKTRMYYRRLLRSSDAMAICLLLAEASVGTTVTLTRIARIVADDPDDEESVDRARKQIKSTESRRAKGEKPRVVDVLETAGILEVQRPERKGQPYVIAITHMGRKAVKAIVPHEKLSYVESAADREARERGEHTP